MKRYLYATAAYAERKSPIGFQTKAVVLTLLAADDEEARAFTLARAEYLWPAAKGWRHEASIVRVSEHQIAHHGADVEPADPTSDEYNEGLPG